MKLVTKACCSSVIIAFIFMAGAQSSESEERWRNDNDVNNQFKTITSAEAGDTLSLTNEDTTTISAGKKEFLANMRAKSIELRRAYLIRREEIVSQMHENGYAIVPGSNSGKNPLFNSSLPLIDSSDTDLVKALRFTPASTQSYFTKITGFRGVVDPFISDVIKRGQYDRLETISTIHHHHIIGLTAITERSIPHTTGKMTIAKPTGNVTVNGVPGDLLVQYDPDTDKGYTFMSFETDTKYFIIEVSRAVVKNSNDFKYLLSMAESLH